MKTRVVVLGTVVLISAVAGVAAALAGAAPGWDYAIVAVLGGFAAVVVVRKGWLDRDS
ncbi:hypothetical protein [Actinokineospora globicatena]|uniref:hypothetical protein n=1 Tax=Actinokineospora globicatena TaxID=103729 RepID=UPI0020A3D41D|nr:hypothetical protein [Actinokineospora globicatena]MCP2303863.1 hypothetical protein [Actinokineospora globicatena]